MKILFDAMGAQVQVQEATKNRLTTWFDSLTQLGYDHTVSDTTRTLASQLAGVDVYVSLTRQYTGPAHSNLQPCTNFTYSQQDLGALQRFVHQDGNSVLMFTNHSSPMGNGPLWPINEIQLAASLNIQLVFASFAPATGESTLTMGQAADAPAELLQGVTSVEALDSGGIVGGTPLIALPSSCSDNSGLGYTPGQCSFASLYTFGAGNVIVMGHSGIAGNQGTPFPSHGQIGAADNLTFLNNCITFLGS
jgi:hypothetical protein